MEERRSATGPDEEAEPRGSARSDQEGGAYLPCSPDFPFELPFPGGVVSVVGAAAVVVVVDSPGLPCPLPGFGVVVVVSVVVVVVAAGPCGSFGGGPPPPPWLLFQSPKPRRQPAATAARNCGG